MSIFLEIQKFRASISSCPKSSISLTLRKEEFSLGPKDNFLKIGSGLTAGLNVELTIESSGGGNDLPNGEDTFSYIGTSNNIWIEADLPAGRAYFKIQYDIILLGTFLSFKIRNSLVYNTEINDAFQYYSDETENIYNESSGVITSLNYGTSYPTSASEELSIIDVSEGFGEYVDLLLTVNDLDIRGYNGDFLKIGPGKLKISN